MHRLFAQLFLADLWGGGSNHLLKEEEKHVATHMFDGLHLKTSTSGDWPSRSFKVTDVATI